MQLAIISDIHDNLANLGKCLAWCLNNGVEEIICCGDVTNFETLNYLANTFTNPIHLVRGNVELYSDEELAGLANINFFGKTGRIDLDGRWVGICHEPYHIEDVLKLGACDIVFYGHTHKPWEKVETRQGASGDVSFRLVNPGTVAGVLNKATFAVWDTVTDRLGLNVLDEMQE